MNIDLATIIQDGGPVGFALLFAWLWLRAEANATKKLAEKEGVIDDLQSEIKQRYKDDLDFYRRLQGEQRGA